VDATFLRAWIDEPGLPADARLVDSDAFRRVDRQREAWEQGRVPTAELATAGWTVQEWLQFLNGASRPHDLRRLAELDARFKLTGSRNAEVAHAWYRLAIASAYPGIEPALEQYLRGIGRTKLVRPLYQDLLRSGDAGAAFARRVYAESRPGYQAATRRSIDRAFDAAGVKPTAG
jgi:hypothetical protein